MHTKSLDQVTPTDIPVLLQTISRAAVTGHGIPTFGDMIQDEPAEATELIIKAMGALYGEEIADAKHEVISYAATGNVENVRRALADLDDAFGNRQTNYCEAYYLVGVAVTLRAVAQARSLVNLDITNVLTQLVTRDIEEGDDRG